MGHPVSRMSPVMFSVPYNSQSPASPSGTMAVIKDSLYIYPLTLAPSGERVGALLSAMGWGGLSSAGDEEHPCLAKLTFLP